MGIQHAFGCAGGSGGITQRRGVGFGHDWPWVVGAASVEKPLIREAIDRRGDKAGWLGDVVNANENYRAHAGAAAVQDGSELFSKARVGDDDLIFGVVDDVPNLVIHELPIERIEHGTHAGNGEEGLKMLGAVVHETGHALVTGDAKLIAQTVGERRRPCSDLVVGGFGVLRPVPGGDLGVGMNRRSVGEDA